MSERWYKVYYQCSYVQIYVRKLCDDVYFRFNNSKDVAPPSTRACRFESVDSENGNDDPKDLTLNDNNTKSIWSDIISDRDEQNQTNYEHHEELNL